MLAVVTNVPNAPVIATLWHHFGMKSPGSWALKSAARATRAFSLYNLLRNSSCAPSTELLSNAEEEHAALT